MYFFNNGFHDTKPDEKAIYLSDSEYNSLMTDLSNGAELKLDGSGRPYAAHTLLMDEMALANLRLRRTSECFSVVNRGNCWYNTLTEPQKAELATWYQSWLDVTQNFASGIDIEMIIPKKPAWIK